jgi:hypothetical protein
MRATKIATAPQTQNTKLLFFSTLGKGPGRENVTILLDEEVQNGSKTLDFKLNVAKRFSPNRSYLIRAEYEVAPQDRVLSLKLLRFNPGSLEESHSQTVFEFLSEPGTRNRITTTSLKPLKKMQMAVTIMNDFVDHRSIEQSELLKRLARTMDEVIKADSGASSEATGYFRLRRL